uniref:GerW family sporulation protein n=2 Tax=Eubacterium TaxID=1730 RepID=UPI002610BB7A
QMCIRDRGERIMKETPVNKIMESTLEKMREMVDVSTIIGEPMVTGNTTLIPVSKVSYGFTSGGTDLPSKQNKELFGGAGGGGISITPVAFIVIQDSKVRLMQINNYTSSADRAIAMIPELVDKLTELTEAKKKDSPAEEKAE